MAGKEVTGYANSTADLFDGASMILTPAPDTLEADLRTLRAFFASVGFRETVLTTPERHDELIAFTSQLCHVVATTFARDPLTAESAGFTAGSFADMTRVATQDADVWSALYAENRDMLLAVIDRFRDRLDEFRAALAVGDDEAVRRMIREGTSAKREELLCRKRKEREA